MTEQNEHISVLLDDEQVADWPRQLHSLIGDVNQRDTLGRYRMIGDVLRHDIPGQVQTDFAAELRARVQQEASHRQAQSTTRPAVRESSGFLSWLWKPAAGFAVAAAVAVVTVSLVQPRPGDLDAASVASAEDVNQARVEQLAATPVAQGELRSVSTSEGVAVPGDLTNWKIRRDQAALQSKLNAYLINHNEFSESLNGIIPQARVVGFDAQNPPQ